jgi:hypothetical protein
VQDFGGEGCGVPHRCRRALAGMSSDRVLANAGSRHGTRDVLIRNSQFALDIFVQCFYY